MDEKLKKRLIVAGVAIIILFGAMYFGVDLSLIKPIISIMAGGDMLDLV